MVTVASNTLFWGNSDQDVTHEVSKTSPSCLKKVKNYIIEFCDSTSIHGFKFLGETKRGVIEKLWWFIVISVSLCYCVILIVMTYQKWMTSPVIVSFATSQTPIHNIPFPAVTICPDIKANKTLFNYTDVELRINEDGDVTPEEIKHYNYMNLLCDKRADRKEEDNATTIDESVLDFLTSVAPGLQETVAEIHWKGNTYYDTVGFFTHILNSEGVCFTFNILDRNDIFTNIVTHYKGYFSNGNSSTWTIENGYKENHKKSYPRYSVVSGIDGGLDVVLFASKDDIDYKCNGDTIGFRISLQHPALVPKGKKTFFSVPLNQIVIATVKPVMIKTSPELRNYAPERRQCFFPDEKQLKFYREYSQFNCLMECLTNFTLETCGCVNYYMPREKITPICGTGSRKCSDRAKVMYLLVDARKGSKSYSQICNCLPTCTSLDYEVEVSQSSWEWYKIYQNELNFTDRVGYSKLRVIFNDMQFINSVRNELYGTTDFLANCGGLLGLFMGFSAISLFEIIYFLSLRLFCNIRTYGLNQWSGPKEL